MLKALATNITFVRKNFAFVLYAIKYRNYKMIYLVIFMIMLKNNIFCVIFLCCHTEMVLKRMYIYMLLNWMSFTAKCPGILSKDDVNLPSMDESPILGLGKNKTE